MKEKQWRNCRIWLETQGKIKLIGHLTERPQVQVIDEAVNRILAEIKTEHPEYSARIDQELINR